MLSDKRKGRNELIGAFLRTSRENAGLTQKALADQIGLEYYTMISQMELGYISIPPALWIPIAKALGIDRADFVLRCLDSYQPELYMALFDQKGRSETSSCLRLFLTGALDVIISKKLN